MNEIEQAWTGVEESDRAIISMRVQANPQSPILVCLLLYAISNLNDPTGILLGPSKASTVRGRLEHCSFNTGPPFTRDMEYLE